MTAHIQPNTELIVTLIWWLLPAALTLYMVVGFIIAVREMLLSPAWVDVSSIPDMLLVMTVICFAWPIFKRSTKKDSDAAKNVQSLASPAHVASRGDGSRPR